MGYVGQRFGERCGAHRQNAHTVFRVAGENGIECVFRGGGAQMRRAGLCDRREARTWAEWIIFRYIWKNVGGVFQIGRRGGGTKRTYMMSGDSGFACPPQWWCLLLVRGLWKDERKIDKGTAYSLVV